MSSRSNPGSSSPRGECVRAGTGSGAALRTMTATVAAGAGHHLMLGGSTLSPVVYAMAAVGLFAALTLYDVTGRARRWRPGVLAAQGPLYACFAFADPSAGSGHTSAWAPAYMVLTLVCAGAVRAAEQANWPSARPVLAAAVQELRCTIALALLPLLLHRLVPPRPVPLFSCPDDVSACTMTTAAPAVVRRGPPSAVRAL